MILILVGTMCCKNKFLFLVFDGHVWYHILNLLIEICGFVSGLVVTFSALIQKRSIRVGTRVDFKNLLSFDSYFY